MEFYSSRFFGRLYIESFNSQRDGILPNLSALISMELKRVSIPNGMEFYGAVLRIGAGVRQSFNSQRDGILHYSTNINSNFFSVSIPNGMEFYFSKRFWRMHASLFQFPTGWNSTKVASDMRRSFFVSIPNGMEFYSTRLPHRRKMSVVSIPNGMEFYFHWFALFRCAR